MKQYKQLYIIKALGFFLILNFNIQTLNKDQSDLSRFDNEKEYEYTVNIETQPAEGQSNNGKIEVISDTIVPDTFSTGQTRIKITKATNNNMTTTTTEIWKTKNPSYWTWKNGSLALTSAAALGIGAWAVSKKFNFIDPYVNYNDNIKNYAQSTEKSFIDNDTENIKNWEVGIYDGDHVILNTEGLPADAPWSEKLAIMFGGTALGYSPAILGACQAYLASIGALGTEGTIDGLRKFNQQVGTKAVAQTAKSNFNSYSQKKDPLQPTYFPTKSQTSRPLALPQSPSQLALPQGPIKLSLPEGTIKNNRSSSWQSGSNTELARERITNQVGSEIKTPIKSNLPMHDKSTTIPKTSLSNAELVKQRMADYYNLN